MDISSCSPYTIAKIVCDSHNLFTPENTQKRISILGYLKTVLDKPIQAKLNEISMQRSFVLLAGDIEVAIYSSLYLHCNRKINQFERVEGYKKHLEEREKRKRELLDKAKSLAHPDVKSLGFRRISSGNTQTINNQVSSFIKSLNNYHFLNCIDVEPHAFIRILPEILGKVVRGDTVFVRGLQNFANSSHTRSLLKIITDAKLNFVPGVSGLFIISVGQAGDLPNEVMNEFKLVYLSSDERKNITHMEAKSIVGDFQNPEKIQHPAAFLDNTNRLSIGRERLPLPAHLADLIRFIAKEQGIKKYVDLGDILSLHYGEDVRNQMSFGKERNMFDREKSKINGLFKKRFGKNLIERVGEKKFGLNIKVHLLKNS